MPFILSTQIDLNSPGMWSEGDAYSKNNIYSIKDGQLPPVHYDEHILRPHSLTHLETPAHTQKDGRTLGSYFDESLKYFYGPTTVLRLPGDHYKDLGNGIFHWEITTDQILGRGQTLASKILITTEFYPLNPQGFHDPNYVLTLSLDAAEYLINVSGFNLYGTSWKSSDYNPGQSGRPIHNTIFKKGLILENLDLKIVPEGQYFMSAFPLPIKNASESPVVPILYTKDELSF